MESDQIALFVLHAIIAYASTKVQDGSAKVQEQSECKSIYVLVINSLSLIIFSQYLKDQLYVAAGIVSLFFQVKNQLPDQTRFVHGAILVAVFALSGGMEALKSFSKEGFTNHVGDYSNYGGVPLFSRNIAKPVRMRKPNMYNLGQSFMGQSNATLRPQDYQYRQVVMNDFDKYPNPDEELMCTLTYQEEAQIERLVNLYGKFTPLYKQIREGMFHYNVGGLIEMMKEIVVAQRDLDQRELIGLARKYVLQQSILGNSKNQQMFEDHACLYIYLNFIVKDKVSKKIYMQVYRLLKNQDWKLLENKQSEFNLIFRLAEEPQQPQRVPKQQQQPQQQQQRFPQQPQPQPKPVDQQDGFDTTEGYENDSEYDYDTNYYY